jgi:hypothetical protein
MGFKSDSMDRSLDSECGLVYVPMLLGLWKLDCALGMNTRK